jgi:D-alanyl-lipoteichoic acid acyltransferase DltB (MBOAT superfamily)
MLFSTVAFAVFFVTAFTVNWLLRPNYLLWRATMVAVSLYFCGWVDLRFVLVVVGMAAVNGALAGAAHRAMPAGVPTGRSRHLVRVAVAADVGVLALLGYHGFLLDSVTAAFDRVGLSATAPVLGLLVPVGVSFFTLHAISYVVDVGRGDVLPVPFGDLLLYMCFFPHLVAGPVVRVDELVPQFHERPDPRRVPATEAFALVGAGLFKAVVIAGFLGTELVDPVFAEPGSAGGVALLVATYAFAVQIYAGFSGATDIAIGCALLLGIQYPRAFDAPYAALSVREFWDRWNLTVSHWLRDYVYVPLGGSRHGARATHRNIMATMVLGGLWYGAGWTYVAWAALHGVYVVAERMLEARRVERVASAAVPAGVGLVVRGLVTFHLVCLAWVFFRADSLGAALDIVGRIATAAPGTGVASGLAVAVVAAMLVTQVLPDRTDAVRARFSSLTPAAQVAVIALVLTLVGVLGPTGRPPFGYFPF